MSKYPVKFFNHQMRGAPVVDTNNGDLVNLLDAVLCDGFNLKSVDSITRVGDVVTVQIAAGHPYVVNQIVAVAGADQADYNGEQQVLSITANSFTYSVGTATPATPATGVITAKVAPLGFEKAFSGTNRRAYRSKNTNSNRPYFYIDNGIPDGYDPSWAVFGRVVMVESMTDIDTFAGAQAPFDSANPTRNLQTVGDRHGWFKIYQALGTPSGAYGRETFGRGAGGGRAWTVVGDDRGFYLFLTIQPGWGKQISVFTDFQSFRQNDRYNTYMQAADFYGGINDNFTVTQQTGGLRSNEPLGRVLMRDQTQVGNPQRVWWITLGTKAGMQTSGQDTGYPGISGVDYSYLFHPIYLGQENGQGLRGKLPGAMYVHNSGSPFDEGVIVENVAGYPGRKFYIVSAASDDMSTNNARIAFDITGPWY